jgi:hypothetical protein
MLLLRTALGVASLLACGLAFSEEPVRPVSLCELSREPGRYSGVVRLRAVYRYGFEVSEVYSTECPNAPPIWLEGPWQRLPIEKPPACSGEWGLLGVLLRQGFAGGTVGLVARGTLLTEGQFGQEGGYKRLFVVDCVETAVLLLDAGVQPESLSREDTATVAAFERASGKAPPARETGRDSPSRGDATPLPPHR